MGNVETMAREIFSVPILLKNMYGTFKSELVKQNRPEKKKIIDKTRLAFFVTFSETMFG